MGGIVRKILSSKWRILAFCVTALVVGISVPLLYNYVLSTSVFSVQRFVFEGNKQIDTETLRKNMQSYRGRSLYGISFDEITSELKKNPLIKSIEIRRAPPDTLIIAIKEREAKASVLLDRTYWVDQDGEIFLPLPHIQLNFLPAIHVQNSSGNLNFQKIIFALFAYEKSQLNLNLSPVDHIKLDKFLGVIVYLKNGLEITLGDDEFEKKWHKFAQVHRFLKSQGKKITYAYMRSDDVDKVIVR